MYCTRCGAAGKTDARYCQNCGTAVSNYFQAKSLKRTPSFRRRYALTFVLALATGIFWFLQRYEINSYNSDFGQVSGWLSLLARLSIVVSFIAGSRSWLAVSAYASTISLLAGWLGALPYGYHADGWSLQLTWVFSLSTVLSFVIISRRSGVNPLSIKGSR